jgi:hypothetical protein
MTQEHPQEAPRTLDETIEDLFTEIRKLDAETQKKLRPAAEAIKETRKGPGRPKTGIHIWINEDGSITLTPIKEFKPPSYPQLYLMACWAQAWAMTHLNAERTLQMGQQMAQEGRMMKNMSGGGGPVA